MFRNTKLQLLATGAVLIATVSAICPVEGPLLARPTNLSKSIPVSAATRNLTKVLQSALNGTINPGFNTANTSFSVGIVSLDSPSPIWEFHHRGTANVNGTSKVDADTQYLVGSISKMISNLMILRTGVDTEAKITEFVPELKGKSAIDWESITFEALGAHLSGIPPNSGFSEFYYLLPVLEQLGFPPLTKDDFPDCGVTALNTACSKEQLLQNVLNYEPIAPPFQRPVYSSFSLSLLAYALQNITGNNYTELLNEYVINPLGLVNTGASPGNTSRAAIPPIDSSWGGDYLDNTPGGGLFSSLSDLSIIAQRTLNKSILSTPAEVRKWLKPSSFTSSLNSLVGMPWEIFRSTNLTPSHPHTIDIYSKSGGAFGYTSQISLVDQYGIGIIVLTAGPADAQPILSDLLAAMILPAAEDEARTQSAKYTNHLTAIDKTNVTIEMDLELDSGPGLKLKNFTRNGTSLLDSLEKFWSIAMVQFGPLDPDIRVHPADISNPAMMPNPSNSSTEIEVIKEEWLITFSTQPNTAARIGSELPGQGAMKDWCTSWQLAGWINWGGEPIDRCSSPVFEGDVKAINELKLETGVIEEEF
ncbi:uncharacterized protein BP5553_08567 [Venustampulla echinocandica]|uniref:Uncharacterized protein n=1 Tax=Venustampulla echinocandica TaxID=2656787 RepID=A0A370TEK4_9HELO|nr:uncharacterized protein BP5553_08567 [Venustampulla echinocandica]RDL33128.1 hypothetical protein BP5553_08567 [Venustampulla echinocandica]